MKKINLLFLFSLIIFAGFVVISLAKSNQNTQKSNPVQTTTVTHIDTPTTASTACIIIISGQKYDVTQYRYQHQGGDVFTCGTDMTDIFNGKHPQNYLNKMKAYLVP